MNRYDDAVRITVDAGVFRQQVEDEVILLHLASDAFYGLDEIGGRMWELLAEHGTLPPVVAALVEEYDVDAATARADLEQLVADLAADGLVRVQ